MNQYCAIVLAAGLGSRLRPMTDRLPKCMVQVGGQTLIERTLDALKRSGVVRRVVIVTGHFAEALVPIAQASALPTTLVHCDAFATTQNVVSLAAGLASRAPGEPWMKLDGDLLVKTEIIAALAGDGARVAVDTSAVLGAEEMKVNVAHGRIVMFGKSLSPKRAAGESIGIEAFSGAAAERVAATIVHAVERGRTDVYYEDVYNDVLAELTFEALAVDHTDWIEVDDAVDLAAAETLVSKGWNALSSRV
ncbi:MAG: phosphocholine cytidylyltransferase family protein [Deltaproteobacteria bacterium]|nr:phosphocholine cytidylyltransferase family protein [Deltaproteobacteria bacterium]